MPVRSNREAEMRSVHLTWERYQFSKFRMRVSHGGVRAGEREVERGA